MTWHSQIEILSIGSTLIRNCLSKKEEKLKPLYYSTTVFQALKQISSKIIITFIFLKVWFDFVCLFALLTSHQSCKLETLYVWHREDRRQWKDPPGNGGQDRATKPAIPLKIRAQVMQHYLILFFCPAICLK